MATQVVKPLVKETTITTGTGSYTLGGAVFGFRRFQDAYTAGAGTYLPYFARMDDAYEFGIGLLSAATTLARTKVLGSSNAGAAVNWGAGTKQVYVGFPDGVAGRHNLTATAAPTGADDFTQGYAAGSLWTGVWLYGPDDGWWLWVCVDSGTTSGAGTAVWHELSPHARRLTEEDGDPSPNSIYLGSADATLHDRAVADECIVVAGWGAKARWATSAVFGLGWSASQILYGGHQVSHIGFVGETTDATVTPLTLHSRGAGFEAIMEPNSAMLVEAKVVARCEADNDMKAWTVNVLVERNGTSDPTIVDAATKTVIGESAGAAAWDVDITIDTAADAFRPSVTGAAAKTIRWSVYAVVTQVANV
jgi:hypothetical protein